MSGRRGQVSTEYLIIVGFVVFLVISILGLGLFYSNSISDRIKLDQAGNYAKKIISTAESVFFQGEPSRVTINAYLPSGVQEIKVEGKSIGFNISTSSGGEVLSYESKVPLEGDLTKTEGVKKIQIIALEDKVKLIEGQ